MLLMGKLTISMAIFNSKLLNYQRVPSIINTSNRDPWRPPPPASAARGPRSSPPPPSRRPIPRWCGPAAHGGSARSAGAGNDSPWQGGPPEILEDPHQKLASIVYSVYVCLHIYIYTYIYNVYIYICMYIYIHIYLCVCEM